ncbi:MAG: hypothetical protein WAV82_12560 [Methylobacter sp.]
MSSLQQERVSATTAVGSGYSTCRRIQASKQMATKDKSEST